MSEKIITILHSESFSYLDLCAILFSIMIWIYYMDETICTRGLVVECLTWDQGVLGSSLTGTIALCPWARHIFPCLVLIQPRTFRPDIIEKLLTRA